MDLPRCKNKLVELVIIVVITAQPMGNEWQAKELI